MNYTLDCEREDDGRWLAEVLELPGVLAYGATQDEAMARAEALALRTLPGTWRSARHGDPHLDPSRGMSQWPAAKAKRVLAALLTLGWRVKRQTGSHKTLAREGWADVVFAFHDGEEIGPRMLARVAKHTGLRPEDL